MKALTIKTTVFFYLGGVVIIHLAVLWNVRQMIWKGYSDFTIYYCAGTMVRRGLGRELYDDAAEFRIQREFSPQVATRLDALPYNHPPFEAVMFAPLTYLAYPFAFVFWDALNLAMLIALMFLLRPHLPQLQNYAWPLLLLTSLAFFPIFAALLQGQDAILLLFLCGLAFVCLKEHRDFFAGGWLALGLFKPQFILPVILLLLVQGRKRVLYGFVPMAALLLLVSGAIVGWDVIILYPQYVLGLENTLARGAIVPVDMPNLRGMLDILFSGAPYIVPAILLISLGLLVFTVFECRKLARKSVFDLNFSLMVTSALLVSYHALIYDLSVLFLPILLLANELLSKTGFRGYRGLFMMTVMPAFFFPPLQLVLYARYHQSAWLGWVLLLWWFAIPKLASYRSGEIEELQNQGAVG
jgi:Glycosyltransferase family 87